MSQSSLKHQVCVCLYSKMVLYFLRLYLTMPFSYSITYPGVESIIHDDITTFMCSSVGHLVSGLIVLFFGMLLVTHRNTFSSDPLADISVFEVLLFSYILCHTILLTVLEPLRAAVKTVYVCFAEYPASLRNAFPLIYQRLSRISEGSSTVHVV